MDIGSTKSHEHASTANERYAQAKTRRDEHVSKVLSSTAERKVVVAGPGTGKTYLFKKLLAGKQRTLTLTFINALVEDLSLELHGMTDVRTLHSFASELLRRLWKEKEVNIFPRLSDVIQIDLRLLTGKEVDFEKVFHTRDDSNPQIEFYRRRKRYYDDSYGFSDIMFAAVKFLEKMPDMIPEYDQIVVDEFQDFNLLEVSLIDLLAARSPVLLAGDDDQALYDFKHADPRHIRERHGNKTFGYEAFNLPLCSRSTRVIVEAANDIVRSATAANLLQSRIAKPCEYFDEEGMDEISDQFPTLTQTHLHESQFAWFIDKKLDEIAGRMRQNFSVLVISPWAVKTRTVGTALRKKGFRNVE